jgi:hypothetical protein
MFMALFVHYHYHHHHHHHKHPGLGHLDRSVSRVTVALSIVSSVSQLFSFIVGCSGMILKEFGFVAFFAGVKASSFCIHLLRGGMRLPWVRVSAALCRASPYSKRKLDDLDIQMTVQHRDIFL